MNDIVYERERTRNIGTNILVFVGGIFMLGWVIFENDEFFGIPLVRHSIGIIGVVIILIAVGLRFSRVKSPYDP